MRTYLISLLMLISCSAWAEWILIGQDDSGNSNYYLDPQTIRKDGVLRKVWEIRNDKTRNKNGALSVRVRSEYDCKNEKVRRLALSLHSGSMASGEVLQSFSYDDNNKLEIAPDTVAEALLKAVCK